MAVLTALPPSSSRGWLLGGCRAPPAHPVGLKQGFSSWVKPSASAGGGHEAVPAARPRCSTETGSVPGAAVPRSLSHPFPAAPRIASRPQAAPRALPTEPGPRQPPSPDVTPAGRGQRALRAAGMGEGAVAPPRHPTGQGDASSSCSDRLTSALRSQTFLPRCSCSPRIFSRLQVWLLQATGLAAGWEPGASPHPLRLQVPSPAAWAQLGPLPAILAVVGEKIWASAWARCPPADPAPQIGVGGVSAWPC